jgi:hypothetical protein
MVEKWVIPFYMRDLAAPSPARDFTVGGAEDTPVHFRRMNAQTSEFVEACVEATPELTLSLLAEFNWRPRVVGARFVAVRRYFELQETVSALLLRSDVCYAGREYCLALAALANEEAAETLASYLDYYLSRRDLYYDQGPAMAALMYLDEVLGSNRAQQFMEPWQRFLSDKSGWNLERTSQTFRESMGIIQDIQQVIARGESGEL